VAAYELRIQQLEADLAARDEKLLELTSSLPLSPLATNDSASSTSQEEVERLQAALCDREETIRQLNTELCSEREKVAELERNQERLLAELISAHDDKTTTRPSPSHHLGPLSDSEEGGLEPVAGSALVTEEDAIRSQEILRLRTQISERGTPEGSSSSLRCAVTSQVMGPEDESDEDEAEHLIPVDIPDLHADSVTPLTEAEVFRAVEELRNDLIFKYREMASAQDRALQSLSSFQTKTCNTLKGLDPALVPPHEHRLFDRFRRRLLVMSRRVFRFSTAAEAVTEPTTGTGTEPTTGTGTGTVTETEPTAETETQKRDEVTEGEEVS
jgi:hypothetical protein